MTFSLAFRPVLSGRVVLAWSRRIGRRAVIWSLLLPFPAVAQSDLGRGLIAGTELIYASGGVRQPAWAFDSVPHEGAAGEYPRCVRFQRRGQSTRQVCARGDTLFERAANGSLRASRPIGPNMRFRPPIANGGTVVYETSQELRRLVDGIQVAVIPTVITTYDSTGTAVRRLREEFAPSLITAVRGVFEEPDRDHSDAWRVVREFKLVEIRASPIRAASPSATAEIGWVGLFSTDLFLWLENANNLDRLCAPVAGRPRDPDRCRRDYLQPIRRTVTLRSAPSADSGHVGSLLVVATPGHGLTAAYLPGGKGAPRVFTPDLYLEDWGYGPYFHQTFLAREGDWFLLSADPIPPGTWLDAREFGEAPHVELIAAEDIVTSPWGDLVVLAVESDGIVARPEQPADMACGIDPLPPLQPWTPLRIPRADLYGERGQMRLDVKYKKGC